MKKDEIIDCFLNKRFVRLKQLIDEAEDLNYTDHDFPEDPDEIDKLSDKERSYFDSIYLEIDKEENSQNTIVYCLLSIVYCHNNEKIRNKMRMT
ncbi:hypothetical protein [Orbus mooreae]|uniref:hypothetical protein n=1 Tax=Orbus mooreae TaxID=3074107 RepID=UPI00370DE22D